MRTTGTEEKCPICQEEYNDPVVCADGYSYCRHCISEWIKNSDEWKSPLTGQMMKRPALLVPDRLRAGRARSARRYAVRSLPCFQRLFWAAVSKCGQEPLFSSSDCKAILTAVLRHPRLTTAFPAVCYAVLELCWRCNHLALYPTRLVPSLLQEERNNKWPFVQRGIIRDLLQALADRFKTTPTDDMENVVIACRDHYKWRMEQVDGIFALPKRRLDVGPIFLRPDLLADHVGSALKFTSGDAATFIMPCVSDTSRCITEDGDFTITSSNGNIRWFTSRRSVPLKEERLWVARRGSAPLAFPDYDGLSTDSSSEESSDDDDDADNQQACPTVQNGTHESKEKAGALDLGPHLSRCTLTILEQPVSALPWGFEYVPCVRAEDRATGGDNFLAEVDEALVTGFISRKRAMPLSSVVSCRRRGRQRTGI